MKNILKGILWFLEGIVAGFAAILPGASGGALCVAFGMYLPLLAVISNPIKNIRKHIVMLGIFAAGVLVGFVGLSGLAAWLIVKDEALANCAFIGFIAGTFPELWKNAGENGRSKNSYMGMILGFLVVGGLLLFLKRTTTVQLDKNFANFFLSGVLWGLSFIVPGLGSSTLLLFFGLYEPLLEGIARFDMSVLVPFGIGMVVCVALLAKVLNAAFNKYHSFLSHTIMGIVAATAVMILPSFAVGATRVFWQVACIVGGAVISYVLTVWCDKIKN